MSRLRALASLLPPSIHAKLLRRWGHDIAPGARIGPLALVQADHLTMEEGARIAPLSRVRGNSIHLGVGAQIESLVTVTTGRLRLGRSASIARMAIVAGDPSQDTCQLTLGDHARVFPFCWIDPARGVSIGNRTGVGGHTLIFTHGSWSNYFKGAPVAFGPVTIEDRVWLPWRVFIMPNVTIGADSIIGAGSVVTSSIPPDSLAAGSPAKVLRQPAYRPVDDAEFEERVANVLADLAVHEPDLSRRLTILRAGERGEIPAPTGATVLGRQFEPEDASGWRALGASVVDLEAERAWLAPGDDDTAHLLRWLSRYGVRFDLEPAVDRGHLGSPGTAPTPPECRG